MPNRIIKESICRSDSIDDLTWFEEVFFYRLMVNCDDYGRYDARPKLLKAALFPLKEGVTLKQVENALYKLSTAGMVQVYEYDHKPYLQLTAWENHQSIRNQKSKYPAPSKEELKSIEINCKQLKSIEINCKQLKSIAPVIQSESESESNPNDSAELSPVGEPPRQQPVIAITLNDKTEYPFYESQIKEWAELFPAVDVMKEMRSMRSWCKANPSRRKTARGILNFVHRWLSKEQDKAHRLMPQRATFSDYAGVE